MACRPIFVDPWRDGKTFLSVIPNLVFAPVMSQKYRPNVAGILQRKSDGKILICERINVRGAWQFPQGGVDDGESHEEALVREMEEEIGLSAADYEVVEWREGYRYKFPGKRLKWGRYRGQEQTYFLCKFNGSDSAIRLDLHKPEFSSFKWIRPKDFDLAAVPEFKRGVYADVFRDFFDVEA